MPLRIAKASVAAAVLAVALAGCTSSTSLISKRTQGYDIPDSALQQIRPGQSQQLVTLVLGSPQTTNTFGDRTAWYYVETEVNQTSFGMTMIQERTVLAIYFDRNKKVIERAVYALEDGKAINIETRRTPSFGEDATFIDTILSSF
ncbi:outer membrane protein assembly factor BamE (lipoprotein component of BamABCDE complex) [Devosia subaequoris]|uniref:Outer membrane protein assembly factor BamE (Lipoprotein component of BamABCDE complex) n=1 Tax=Devosia subaequoris TaxID=395930 RepID=A0A7W6IJL8_9HYPH|nr:outer membrane protein assembly factor BamE [Devosia subaequoris]MBB4050813.1 outer membrane protein assembly factor BamE (lipoprotein component of BamABCDE complex) [Devosia subaequoris]MCP1208509.1 outer membrane protein assembly factor BamE [Devosia subaequoris]